jgi:hypothetical protein
VEEKLEDINRKIFYLKFFVLPSLAAIRDGKGGQQKRQQRSRIDNVFIVQSSEKKRRDYFYLTI